MLCVCVVKRCVNVDMGVCVVVFSACLHHCVVHLKLLAPPFKL